MDAAFTLAPRLGGVPTRGCGRGAARARRRGRRCVPESGAHFEEAALDFGDDGNLNGSSAGK